MQKEIDNLGIYKVLTHIQRTSLTKMQYKKIGYAENIYGIET